MAALTAAATLTLLAACGTADGDTPAPTASSSAPVEVTAEPADTPEPTGDATTEEPTEDEPWPDGRGYVDRTDIWAVFDERTFTLQNEYNAAL